MTPASPFFLNVPVVPDKVRFGLGGPFILGVGHVVVLLSLSVFFFWGSVAVGASLFLFAQARRLPCFVVHPFSLLVVGSASRRRFDRVVLLKSVLGGTFLHTLLATSLLESSSSLDPYARIQALSAAKGMWPSRLQSLVLGFAPLPLALVESQ